MVARDPIIKAKTPHATIIQNVANIYSYSFAGPISPYPTVVMVVSAQLAAATY